MKTHFLGLVFGPAFSGPASALLVDAALKGFVLLAAAAILTLVLRRAAAATRHLIWLSALVCTLVVPAAAGWLPQWRVLPASVNLPQVPRPQFMAVPAPPVAAPQNQSVAAPPGPVLPEATGGPQQRVSVPSQGGLGGGAARAGSQVVLLVWLGGVALLLLPLGGSFLRLRRVAANAQSLTEGPLFGTMNALRNELGLKRNILLFLGDADAMPMVWGIRRPRLLLPADATAWAPSRLRGVLVHELAHLRRHDPLSTALAQVALALHWFNPLAWLAVAGLRLEQERACDDCVLGRGLRASDYAEDLVALAIGRRALPFVTTALAMADPARLENRIVGILDAAQNRRALSLPLALAAGFLALAIALPLGMLQAQDSTGSPPVILGPPTPAPALEMQAVTTGNDFAQLQVDGKSGNLAFVVGEQKEARVILHEFGLSSGLIGFELKADDRRGHWWDQVKVTRTGEANFSFPILPEDWLPGGRVVFLPKPEKRADGATVFAAIETAAGKIPIAVRAASAPEILDALYRKGPRTCPDTSVFVEAWIYAVAKDAPTKALLLPVMAARDLVGIPRGALGYPSIDVIPGRSGIWGGISERTEKLEVAVTKVPEGFALAGKVSVPVFEGEYASAAEALHRNDLGLPKSPDAAPALRRLQADFSATFRGNDALVVPILSSGLFPETLVSLVTVTSRNTARIHWLPPGARSPIRVDGWVLSWPRTEHAWFASLFDYADEPATILRNLKRRKEPTTASITSEWVGFMDDAEVQKLREAFGRRPGVKAERVEPFLVPQNNSGIAFWEQDSTPFIAGGQHARMKVAVQDQSISPMLKWDAPVQKHLSASPSIGVDSGKYFSVLLPGSADPEEIRLLILRCVNPDIEPAR